METHCLIWCSFRGRAAPSPGCVFIPSSFPSFQGNHLHGNLKHPGSALELLAVPGTWWGRMKLLGAVLLAAGLLGTTAWGEQHPWPDEPSQTCFFETLSSADSKFCRGDLEVIYPELGDVGCTYIPKCHQYRRRISREWGSPRVQYPWAEEGADLKSGDIKGHVLTDYTRPTPPPRSGYHRYQLRLYEQPPHEAITLSPEERVSLGAWAMESFVEQFRLGSPVASTQFLTKYYED
ncbi:phosphatidylethanolamine-binding protein 4 isoform X1 [Opisthocomus hoazin]|uniref:phosphatidylethanolamine-binding protein 4 isoform X1 n=1 Tax=Opisthocomus hoazin TaxID=30419 RepID=UPI003F530E2B